MALLADYFALAQEAKTDAERNGYLEQRMQKEADMKSAGSWDNSWAPTSELMYQGAGSNIDSLIPGYQPVTGGGGGFAPTYQQPNYNNILPAQPGISATSNPSDTTFVPTAKYNDRVLQARNAADNQAYNNFTANMGTFNANQNAQQRQFDNYASLLPYTQMTAAQKLNADLQAQQEAEQKRQFDLTFGLKKQETDYNTRKPYYSPNSGSSKTPKLTLPQAIDLFERSGGESQVAIDAIKEYGINPADLGKFPNTAQTPKADPVSTVINTTKTYFSQNDITPTASEITSRAASLAELGYSDQDILSFGSAFGVDLSPFLRK